MEHPFKDLKVLFTYVQPFEGEMGLSCDIFSRDIFYCLLHEVETLKASILKENESSESSQGIGHFRYIKIQLDSEA